MARERSILSPSRTLLPRAHSTSRAFGIVPSSVVVVGLIAFATSCTPPAGRTNERLNAESEVRQAQRERFEAMTKGDVAALDTLLDDEMAYVSPRADLQSKPQFIATIRKQTLVYESIAPVEVKVRVYDGLALATGRAQMRVRNAAGVSSFGIRFTEVYLRRDGQWLLTAWETTRSKS